MGFFPEEAVKHYKAGRTSTLASTIKSFPPVLKQAMYAAAEKNLIKRGTWNGCAFNAAGLEVSAKVSGMNSAAKAFNVPVGDVQRFITTWDSMSGSDARCTGLLKAALLDIGLTEESSTSARVKRVISGYAYKSLETKFHEELAEVHSIADLTGMDDIKADAVQVLLNA